MKNTFPFRNKKSQVKVSQLKKNSIDTRIEIEIYIVTALSIMLIINLLSTL